MEMQDVIDVQKQIKHGIDSSCDDITTVERMKQDLKTIKQLLRSLGLLLAILLTVSLIAVLIAALAYSKSAGSQVSKSDVQNISSSELLRILNESNLYQGCYEITRSCKLSTNNDENIKPYCQTTYLDVNSSVSLK